MNKDSVIGSDKKKDKNNSEIKKKIDKDKDLNKSKEREEEIEKDKSLVKNIIVLRIMKWIKKEIKGTKEATAIKRKKTKIAIDQDKKSIKNKNKTDIEIKIVNENETAMIKAMIKKKKRNIKKTDRNLDLERNIQNVKKDNMKEIILDDTEYCC